jgi:hypothetical protein
MTPRTPPTEFTHEAGQMTGEGPYTPRTSTTALDVAWEALWLALGNEDAGPAGIIARHRPLIEAAVWDLAEEACAEARAEGLDVERLARALYVIWPNDNQWDAQPVWFREKAEAIAREYAALEEPTDD